MNIDAVRQEAVRLLQLSDDPGIYRRIRRWISENLRNHPQPPIDIIAWPKGSLMVGLMHQTEYLQQADNSHDRASAIMCMAEVKDHLDRWIRRGSPIYTVDDCVAGKALLMLADLYQDIDQKEHALYMQEAAKIADFLKNHPKDQEGSLPYRTYRPNGQIFADGVGMILPFAIHYGLVCGDEDLCELGMNQIRNYMEHAFDEEAGQLWHVYELEDTRLGAPAWGRAAGWIVWGVSEACSFLDKRNKTPGYEMTFMEIRMYKELMDIRERLTKTVLKYRREDGLFGCLLDDVNSPVDTSASAMILCGMSDTGEITYVFEPYITDDGKVLQAQGECIDIGVYSENYASYPWSVGMFLTLEAYGNH